MAATLLFEDASSSYGFIVKDIFGIDKFEEELKKTKNPKQMHYRFEFGKTDQYHVDFKLEKDTHAVWTAEVNDKIMKLFESAKEELKKVLETVKKCLVEFVDTIDDLEKSDVMAVRLEFELDSKKVEESKKMIDENIYTKFENLSEYRKRKEEYSYMNKYAVVLKRKRAA